MKRKIDSLNFEVVEVSEENPDYNPDEFLADLLVRFWIEKHNNRTSSLAAKGGEYDRKVESDYRSGEGGNDDNLELGKRREESKITAEPDRQRFEENQK